MGKKGKKKGPSAAELKAAVTNILATVAVDTAEPRNGPAALAAMQRIYAQCVESADSSRVSFIELGGNKSLLDIATAKDDVLNQAYTDLPDGGCVAMRRLALASLCRLSESPKLCRALRGDGRLVAATQDALATAPEGTEDGYYAADCLVNLTRYLPAAEERTSIKTDLERKVFVEKGMALLRLAIAGEVDVAPGEEEESVAAALADVEMYQEDRICIAINLLMAIVMYAPDIDDDTGEPVMDQAAAKAALEGKRGLRQQMLDLGVVPIIKAGLLLEHSGEGSQEDDEDDEDNNAVAKQCMVLAMVLTQDGAEACRRLDEEGVGEVVQSFLTTDDEELKEQAAHLLAMLSPEEGGGATASAAEEVEAARQCGHCGGAEGGAEPFKACGGCHEMFYCSREHQKAHWKQHKKDCKKA